MVFKNYFPSTDGLPTTAALDDPDKASLAAYVTGGVQFPSVQAIDKNEDGDALIDVGKVGIDEYLLSIDVPSVPLWAPYSWHEICHCDQ